MALSPKLELRQGQQLVMTPQLQQAIRLLQFSNIELAAFVDAELERNPLLERDERPEAGEPVNPAEALGPDERASRESEGKKAEEWLDLSAPATDAPAALDTDPENVYPDTTPMEIDPQLGAGGWTSLRMSGGGDGEADLEAYVSSEPSLKDHLSQQLLVTVKDPVERLIGQHLIDMVDEAGYLSVDLDELAQKLGCPAELIERVLGVLQTFDPTGVCARSLAECLALQLKDQNRYDPQIALLLENLQLLAEHNLPRLRREVGVEMDELADMIREIKQLSPKPGLRFGSVQLQPVVPDVLVRPASDGGWIVELNSDTLPRVLVNRSYYARVNKRARDAREKDFIADCLNTANWLAKSLDQRARTILRVAEEIVRQQDAFLSLGVRHLRPINLKTVADAIKMHESTVSRVTSNKYMATPRGVFELKYFFTSAIAASGEGEALSSEAVRHRIRELIDAEPPEDVLSDDSLVDRLRADGIDIARRTVAKYRESMRIPSSLQRRREKKLKYKMASLG
ncbi:MAG: RNA polymerase factor sigma-54 [Hyphomicrobiaceae bacterium]